MKNAIYHNTDYIIKLQYLKKLVLLPLNKHTSELRELDDER